MTGATSGRAGDAEGRGEMASIKDQLSQLDQLKNDGLITDAEYQAKRDALLDDATSRSVSEKKGRRGGILKWGLLGCLGMFAAVGAAFVGLIVLIIIAVGSGAGDHKDVHVAYAEGSSGTVTTAADVKNRVTITKITDPAQSTNQFQQPAAGKHYLTIAVTIENAGSRETTGGSFTLRTADGTEYDNTVVSGVDASDINFLQGLTSGGRTQAVIAFEVADGQKVQWVKFDPNPFAAGDLYFDAK